MGHDRGHVAIGLKARQHVLDEHEVSLFSRLRAPLRKREANFNVARL